jgi:hypothetical protein
MLLGAEIGHDQRGAAPGADCSFVDCSFVDCPIADGLVAVAEAGETAPADAASNASNARQASRAGLGDSGSNT